MEKDVNTWSEKDVSEFLLFNQCAAYCGVFLSQVITFLKKESISLSIFCIIYLLFYIIYYLFLLFFQNVDGKKLLNLNKGEIIHMTGNKVGPSLKIYDLIQKLKNNTKRKKYM